MSLSGALTVQEKDKTHQHIQEPSITVTDTQVRGGHRKDMVSSDGDEGQGGQDCCLHDASWLNPKCLVARESLVSISTMMKYVHVYKTTYDMTVDNCLDGHKTNVHGVPTQPGKGNVEGTFEALWALLPTCIPSCHQNHYPGMGIYPLAFHSFITGARALTHYGAHTCPTQTQTGEPARGGSGPQPS